MPSSIAAIISCYNSEKFIEKALSSVFSQSYPVNEIICVDDGSKDNTIKIIEKYSNVKLVIHEQNVNKGCAASLNLAVKQANSDYIAFLDHDDFWLKDKIRRQVELLDSDKKIAMVYTNGYAVDENWNKLYDLLPDTHVERNDPSLLLLDCYIKSCSTVAIRKNIFFKCNMFNEELLALDHDLWLKVIEKFKIGYIKEQLYEYRIHSCQNTLRREMYEDGFKILNDALQRYDYKLPNVKRKRLAAIHYRIGMNDLHNKKYLSYAYSMLQAFINDPTRSLKEAYDLLMSKFYC